ncbi:MAG: hypothetical protein AAFQ58_19240 [Pseudomonadota bacterium]
MKFLDDLLSGTSAEDLKMAAGQGDAIGQLVGQFSARGVVKAQAETRRKVSKINARAAARDARYQQGLATVSNAAQGADGYSNAVFQAAENAREATLRVEAERLSAKLQSIDAQAALPSPFSAAGGFALNMIGTYAKRNQARAAREI